MVGDECAPAAAVVALVVALVVELLAVLRIAILSVVSTHGPMATDSKAWTPLPNENAPSPRWGHFATTITRDGSKMMIVGGGCDANGVCLNDVHVYSLGMRSLPS